MNTLFKKHNMSKTKSCHGHELFTDQYLRELFKEFDQKKTGYIELIVFEKLLNSIGFVSSLKKKSKLID